VPTIFDLLDRLDFLRGMPASAILLLAAFVVVAAWDLRLAVPALLLHYLLVGLLFVDVLDPRLAFVYALAGLFVAAILLVTARQVNWGRLVSGASSRRAFGRLVVTRASLLRLGLAALALAAAVALTQFPVDSPLLQPVTAPESASLNLAVVGLVSLGLVGMTTSPEPLPSGMGLLLFLTGFALYYGFVDQSLAMTVALVVAQLVTALAMSYLAQARYLPEVD
jgi:hypothetical protein